MKYVRIESNKDGTVNIKFSSNGWQWTVIDATKEELTNVSKMLSAAVKNKTNWKKE